MPTTAPAADARLCSACVLPDSVPGIVFDDDGVCNVCRESTSASAPAPAWPTDRPRRSCRASNAAARADYDVLCLYSGGKDSTFMLYTLSETFKLRVLAMTLDNWFLSEGARQNIITTLDKLPRVDHVMVRPSWQKVRKMFHLGFDCSEGDVGDRAYLVGHACLPCFGLIGLHAGRLALEKKIPNLVIGTTPGQMTQKNVRDLNDRYSSTRQAFRSLFRPLLKRILASDDELAITFHISLLDKIRMARLNLIPFYDVVRYDESDILETITTQLGWQRPADTDSCSTNCRINALGIHVHRKRHGMSPYAIPLAADVRGGLVTREEALEQVNAPLDMAAVRDAAEQLGATHLL